ncbi:alpha/beta hydrolase fold domain-containing protein [Metabacillus halosaccharovorans]|uniref:alpha/beta hydrolase fold domain-containing protein n=1 Tax=Metabacillus halosaccharovorans TaxID=930124 RepID=UPI0037352FF7
MRWFKWIFIPTTIIGVIFGSFSIYVTKVEGRSVQSKLVETLLKVQNDKINFTDKEKVNEFLEDRKVQNAKTYKLPDDLELKSKVKQDAINGMQVFSLSPTGTDSKKKILYLHGGAYINQPTNYHWKFLDNVVTGTNATVIVPIYPKAPDHQYKESFDKLLPIYEDLLKETDPKNVGIMGDSAGGGLALALSQFLLEKNIHQPENIILLSPWLDITMKNPEIPLLEDKDPMLGAYGLEKMGEAWAGDTDPNNYMLSPINGTIKGLGKITLFVGTHELFLADAQKFRDMASNQGIEINYYEYEKMNHVFPVYPIPEAKKATEQIVNIINNQ